MNNSNIYCGKYNFCVGTENNNKNYYCYGNRKSCLWRRNDCTKDSDCSKYNLNSKKYTDKGRVCSNFIKRPNTWPGDACVKGLSNTVPNTVPNTSSNTVPNTVPNTVSNTVPNTVSNTASNTVPNTVSNTVSNIYCGKYNFCVGTENDNKNYYCYGDEGGCLWDSTDCTKDSDCNKYNINSKKYTDSGKICSDYSDKPDTWPGDTCKKGSLYKIEDYINNNNSNTNIILIIFIIVIIIIITLIFLFNYKIK